MDAIVAEWFYLLQLDREFSLEKLEAYVITPKIRDRASQSPRNQLSSWGGRMEWILHSMCLGKIHREINYVQFLFTPGPALGSLCCELLRVPTLGEKVDFLRSVLEPSQRLGRF